MQPVIPNGTTRTPRSALRPGYVVHPSFSGRTARTLFDPAPLLDGAVDYGDRYMPDDVTRDHTRRMHYAAYRMHRARTAGERRRWQLTYFALRDRVVMGNRKLIYRAVRRRMASATRADDMIGDCHIVLIHAVAAFNPWLGVRFSTYAYTCLVRALSRSAQRLATDWLSRSVPLDVLPDGEPGDEYVPDRGTTLRISIDEFLRNDHPLLTAREKRVLTRRFCLGDCPGEQTLERVGRSVGLSKERVRQVQALALSKLRGALRGQPGTPAEPNQVR